MFALLTSLFLGSPAHAAWPPEVLDAVAVGNCELVDEAFAEGFLGPVDDGVRLVVGRCALSTDPDRALGLLDAVTGDALRPYARWLSGEAHLARGEHEAALARLGGPDLPGAPDLRRRLARGRALLALERSLDARPDLRALLDTDVGDEARFLLAEGGRQRGEDRAAIATYRKVWTDSVRGPWSDRAAEALAALHVGVPDLLTAEGRALVRSRIGALSSAQRHAEALALLRRLRVAEDTTEPDGSYALALFRARVYPEAVAAWDAVHGVDGARATSASNLFLHALAASRTGDYPRAAALYARVTERFPTHAKGVEASYKQGYLPYDAGDCAPAIQGFAAHVARYPSSRFADEAAWFTALCQWRDGKTDAAVATWTRLVADHPRSSLAPGAAYWLAEAVRVAGDAADADARLAALIDTYPSSGHAWFAAKKLGTPFPSPPAVEPPSWPAHLASDPDLHRAEALIAAGLRTWAADVLRPLAARVQGDKAASLALADALVRAGDGRAARRIVARWCPRDPREGEIAVRRACHPRPELTLVTRTAEAYGLPPLLPFAVMWSESGMDPTVTSYAGARGLMQIMPAEYARLHAEAFGDGTGDPDRLYDAATNALLGTTELGVKRRSLDGLLEPDVLPAVIASYNGGEDAVRRWVEAAGGPPVPMDRFAEDIGYTQTRRYVRGVLGHLMDYLWVYGQP